ncbi:uncharacterized protein M6B38_409510 [Iris pallida]|uniref:Uncharacterized protein n=1 Tax=Iris pallida TaxID=29817 RepID=A0AAX6FN67_IRIPA|nr:uncharacterized protein M6B38_409510 [Iris pallida]
MAGRAEVGRRRTGCRLMGRTKHGKQSPVLAVHEDDVCFTETLGDAEGLARRGRCGLVDGRPGRVVGCPRRQSRLSRHGVSGRVVVEVQAAHGSSTIAAADERPGQCWVQLDKRVGRVQSSHDMRRHGGWPDAARLESRRCSCVRSAVSKGSLV